MHRFEVVVELKPEVLDTQGRAIQGTLERLGHQSLRKVSVTKRFVLELSSDEAFAHQEAEKLAREYLANPVSELFSIRKLASDEN